MAQITQGVHIIYGGTSVSPSWDKVKYNEGTEQQPVYKYLCIKDFPDMDNADKDQIETTTLCDDAHTFIDGLGNLPDELSFTCNYDEDLWGVVAGYSAEAHWGIQIGDSGAKWTFKATARMVLVGGGVGDVLEMRVVLKPKSSITVS